MLYHPRNGGRGEGLALVQIGEYEETSGPLHVLEGDRKGVHSCPLGQGLIGHDPREGLPGTPWGTLHSNGLEEVGWHGDVVGANHLVDNLAVAPLRHGAAVSRYTK